MLVDSLNKSIIYTLNKELNFQKYYIILILVIIYGIIILVIPYTDYKSYILYVYSSEYQLIVDEDFFPIKNNNLYIEKQKYDYKILSIKETIVNNKKYYQLTIDISLNKNIKKTNNIIKVNIKKGQTNLFNLIKKCWKDDDIGAIKR